MSDANVARGHKANLSNPNTSEESKIHSLQVLEEMGEDVTASEPEEPATIDGKDEGNVLRGHKAAISNPRVSEEAKEHSREVLEEHGAL
ncbi:hypothetical protein SCHPADRAFT_996597 [Schizopora paradoxa]|uniref:Conidiation protein 6 n=1 Tax=Schizopora paradoxa TaxID=27342 RepID=A0A0H2RSD0_9AGAM|nr:hypothetical protein SCHPADRAFT_996597 [Schizopora paradoxa]